MHLFLQDLSGEGVYSFTTAGYVLFVAFMVAALLLVSYFVNNDGERSVSSSSQLQHFALRLPLFFQMLSSLKLLWAAL